MVKSVSFNGKEIPEFIKVTKRTVNVLPLASPEYSELPVVAGGVYHRTKLKSTQITLDIKIIPESYYGLDNAMDVFAEWLTGDDFKPSKLVFKEQTDKYRLATVTGSTDINDLFFVGEGYVTFLCINPLKFSVTELNKSILSSQSVDYSGTCPANPIVTCTLTKSGNLLKITVENKSMKLIGNFTAGQKIEIDSGKHSVKINGIHNQEVIELDSEWHTLSKGNNKITVSVDNALDTSVKITVQSKIIFY